MQQYCRFEIISVSREENFLPCSTEWDKSVYFTPSNHTITADNGNEFAKHQEIAEKMEISFYFCTRVILGNVVPMRTRTDSSGNTSPKERISVE